MSNSADHTKDALLRMHATEVLSRLTLEKNAVIFQQGQESNDLFLIESGSIGVYKSAGKKTTLLATLQKGAMFGEMAAFTNAPRSATAVALEYSVIVRIPRSLVVRKFEACDPFIKALIEIVMSNLNRVNERYVVKDDNYDKLLRELKTHEGN